MNEGAVATFLLFLLYGPAVAPFTYCIRSDAETYFQRNLSPLENCNNILKHPTLMPQ